MSTVLKRQALPEWKAQWLHYLIVDDQSVTVLEFEPAAWSGWRLARSARQGPEAWPNMTEREIVAFKSSDSVRVDMCRAELEPGEAARILADLPRLLAIAEKRAGAA